MANRRPRAPALPIKDPRGPKKGQKMAIFGPLRRKVQGEWGGSAHSPDPTAQSAHYAAPRRTRARTHAGRVGRAVGGLWWLLGGLRPLLLLDWELRLGRTARVRRKLESSAGAKANFRGVPPLQRVACSSMRTTRNPCPARRSSEGGSSVLDMLSHVSASHRDR